MTTRPSAVQYVRMSTEHQRYSIENQMAAIADYAQLEGYDVVRTYSDAGKSGLQLKGRRQLQQLLSDCLSPDRDFEAILVLDVSRWGRFQDPDQAAYYEYICRGAGVRVAYVGETFENDGGLVSSIVKHLKRVMAAEYSRELSDKVTRAKRQQAKLGFRQGGPPGYGFRRQLIDEQGGVRRVLAPRQFKAVHTDRVTTIPGPAEELGVIRRIFDLFVRKHGTFSGVADQLNREGVATNTGNPWSAKRVGFVIRNDLCVGTYAYGKTERHLGAQTIRRPREEWILVPGGPPVIAPSLFARANRIAAKPRQIYSDKAMLKALRKHLATRGHVSAQNMKADLDLPHPRTYEERFGSLREACLRIGHQYGPRQRWRPAIRGFWTQETIIDAVQRWHRQHGEICAKLLNSEPTLPSVNVINRRFGGLIRCYEAANIPLSPEQLRFKAWKSLRPRKSDLLPEGLLLGPITSRLVQSRAEALMAHGPTMSNAPNLGQLDDPTLRSNPAGQAVGIDGAAKSSVDD